MAEALRREEDEPITPEPNSRKLEHLTEGIKPIMACIGTNKDYTYEFEEILNIRRNGESVDYASDVADLDRKQFKNAGYETYVISTIDNKPKYTDGLCDCTSLIAVGKDIKTGEEISFLSHQDPKKFLIRKKQDFEKHLEETLEQFKKRCEQGTIDIVITGGNAGDRSGDEYFSENYRKSLRFLDSAVEKVIGFQPTVVAGPKGNYSDDVYFDTENRRLYIVRPSTAFTHNHSFKPKDIDQMKEAWNKDRDDFSI